MMGGLPVAGPCHSEIRPTNAVSDCWAVPSTALV